MASRKRKSTAIAVAVPVTTKRKSGYRKTKTLTLVGARPRKKRAPVRGTLAAAKKIAKALGPEVKGPYMTTKLGVLQSPYSNGGSATTEPEYIAPTFVMFTRADWNIPRGPKDVERIGNEIIPVKWSATINLTIPQNFWKGYTTAALQAATQTVGTTTSSDIFYNGWVGRNYFWPDGAAFKVHVYLARARGFATTNNDATLTVNPIAWQRFWEASSTAGAAAITGNPIFLDRQFEVTDHWQIKKKWTFLMSPERNATHATYSPETSTGTVLDQDNGVYTQLAAAKDDYPSTKTIKLDLTKYLPKRLTYDDDTSVNTATAGAPTTSTPGNVNPLIMFLCMYPLGTYVPQRFTDTNGLGVKPTVPWQSGLNQCCYVNCNTTMTWMDP